MGVYIVEIYVGKNLEKNELDALKILFIPIINKSENTILNSVNEFLVSINDILFSVYRKSTPKYRIDFIYLENEGLVDIFGDTMVSIKIDKFKEDKEVYEFIYVVSIVKTENPEKIKEKIEKIFGVKE